jgi:hypothetical protein
MLPGSFALRDIIKDRLDEDRRIGPNYSNSDSIVWTHASIFETLWTQSKSFPKNQLEQ